MFEQTLNLDTIFGSLADPTRRDILRRVAAREMSVTEIAEPYSLTFAAISKHLQILANARLVIKNRRGKQQFVQLSPHAFHDATQYLKWYEQFLEERFDALDNYLRSEE